jgi:hypothetical protein
MQIRCGTLTASANFNQRRDLLNARIGRRPVLPVKCDTAGAGQSQYRGVSDHRSGQA